MKGKRISPERSKVGKRVVMDTAMSTKDGFKKGGKVGMNAEGVMSAAHAGRKPRKSGGGVFSSAAGGTPRGSASNC